MFKTLRNTNTQLQALNSNSSMLLNLVNDMMDLVKDENLSFKFNNVYFNLIESVKTAFKTLQYLSKTKKINTELVVNPEEVHYFTQVYGDPNRMMQVLINFVSNSLKFTREGGSVKIELSILNSQTIATNRSSAYITELVSSEESEEVSEDEYVTKLSPDENKV